MSKYKMIIAGIPTTSDTFFDVLNPADESLVDACPAGTGRDVELAVGAARAALAEALTRANALDVGLGGSVWGNDVAEATLLATHQRTRST